jgi:beta-glucosidase/6-phospho-beta-glucosidase/beta-galactosidase
MRRTALLILLATLALVPAPAHASQSQESLFEDEASLLYSGAERRDQTLDELRDLGVDVIRANVTWNRYAPSPRAKSKPTFDATDPNAYPLGEVDALVTGAAARGMTVLLTPTVPGPAWASSCGGSSTTRRICNPKPAEYGDFVEALGKRYPTVTRWSFMNEPNQGGWLTPQWKKSGRSYIPAAPTTYRNLVRAATAALDASGHTGDQMLLGETAPIGRTSGSYSKRSLAPGDFYRELF